MARPAPPSDLAMLHESWRQWTSVVEIYATRSWRRKLVKHGDYRRLHGRLLRACRSAAEQADGEQRAFYESLEELAKPWLTPRILDRTSDRYLADLFSLCGQAEKKLTGRERPRPWSRWLVPATLVGAAGAVLALVVIASRFFGWAVGKWVRSLSVALYYAAIGTTWVQRLVIAGMILAAVAIGVVARTRRS